MISLAREGGVKLKKFKVEIRQNLCKACAICYTFCPKDVLRGDPDGKALVTQPDNCIGCRLCEMRCPDYAIRVWEDGQ